MEEIKQRARHGILWSALGSWGNQVISFAVFIILTRLLAPKDFGLLGMATVFTTFVGIIAEQGFGQAIVQRRYLSEEHLDTAFWTSLAIGAGLTFFGILFSRGVAFLYGEPQLASVIAILSVTFFLTALKSTQQGYLTRKFDFRSLSMRQLIAVMVGGVAGILAALLGWGVYALVIKAIVTGLVDIFLLWKISDWRPRFHYSREHLGDLLRFGLNMVGFRITNFVRRYSDDLLIGFFLGAVTLGYYTVAYRLARLLMDMLDSVMGRVLISTFARLQDDPFTLRQVTQKTIKLVNLVTFPLFSILIILAPDIILLFSGEKWQASVPIMRILTFSGFFLTTQIILSYLMIGLGKMALLLRVNLVNAITYVFAFSLSVRSGIYFVGLSYSIVSVLYLGVYLALSHWLIDFDYKKYFFHLFRSAVSAGIMAGAACVIENIVMTYWDMPVWVGMAFTMVAGFTAYSASVFVFQRIELFELRKIIFSTISLNFLKKQEQIS